MAKYSKGNSTKSFNEKVGQYNLMDQQIKYKLDGIWMIKDMVIGCASVEGILIYLNLDGLLMIKGREILKLILYLKNFRFIKFSYFTK